MSYVQWRMKAQPRTSRCSLPLFNRAWLPESPKKTLGVKWEGCRSTRSLDGLQVPVERFFFRGAVVSKQSRYREAQWTRVPKMMDKVGLLCISRCRSTGSKECERLDSAADALTGFLLSSVTQSCDFGKLTLLGSLHPYLYRQDNGASWGHGGLIIVCRGLAYSWMNDVIKVLCKILSFCMSVSKMAYTCHWAGGESESRQNCNYKGEEEAGGSPFQSNNSFSI